MNMRRSPNTLGFGLFATDSEAPATRGILSEEAFHKGTVQSDRWTGKASMLAGSKLIAVVPVLGWWERRPEMLTREMPFSLIVSVVGDGIYTAVQGELAAEVLIEV